MSSSEDFTDEYLLLGTAGREELRASSQNPID
jgi:hypothetical protein